MSRESTLNKYQKKNSNLNLVVDEKFLDYYY
jgi:hypothetical protein